MKLADQREAYKAFFVNNENGVAFYTQALAVMRGNIDRAQDDNDMQFLSRSKGNKEILDLIDNVLKTEGKPKE